MLLVLHEYCILYIYIYYVILHEIVYQCLGLQTGLAHAPSMNLSMNHFRNYKILVISNGFLRNDQDKFFEHLTSKPLAPHVLSKLRPWLPAQP